MGSKRRELEASIAKSVDEAKQAAQLAVESAAKVGIGVKATEFANARDSHRRWANGWAAAGIATALTLLCVVVRAAGDTPPRPDGMWYVAANLSFYLPRALTVSIFSWLVVFFARNFRAAKHNEIVNGHRAGALATHEHLAASFRNEATSPLIGYVAEAVFGAQASGYSEAKAETTSHLGEVIEATKGLRGG